MPNDMPIPREALFFLTLTNRVTESISPARIAKPPALVKEISPRYHDDIMKPAGLPGMAGN